MSNHWNAIAMEDLFVEGLKEGEKLGLQGDKLEFFAINFAKKYFNKRGES